MCFYFIVSNFWNPYVSIFMFLNYLFEMFLFCYVSFESMCLYVCYFVVFKHLTPLTLGVMATRGRNSHPSMSCLNYGAKDVMEATNFYNINV